jgi:hypothetical protein
MGIPEEPALLLMPLIGCFDIAMGVLLLHRPRRVILLWMFGWAVWTALLRPLAGESIWEVWERGGNYGPPFALLILGGAAGVTLREWFGEMNEPVLTRGRVDSIALVLRVSLALLLIGHGGFGLFVQKQMLIEHYQAIGIPAGPRFGVGIGAFELALAAWVLIKPFRGLLWLILVWKVFSESLYLVAGNAMDVFEFIERWGNYGIPVALLLILSWRRAPAAPRA